MEIQFNPNVNVHWKIHVSIVNCNAIATPFHQSRLSTKANFTTFNCVKKYSPLKSSSGIITDKSSLPVTRLNFGRILTQPSSGRHSLSRLECYGRQPVQSPKPLPKSCQDLRRTGHTISGFYSVLRSGVIETVFCDMTQMSGEEKAISSFVSPEQLASVHLTVLIVVQIR